MPDNQIKIKYSDILLYLVILTLFFILFEVSFFIQSNKAYVNDFISAKGAISIPGAIIPQILAFIGAHLLIHAVFCLLVFACVVGTFNAIPNSRHHQTSFTIAYWVIGISTALTYNAQFFPNSKFARLWHVIIPWQSQIEHVQIALTCTVAVVMTIAVLVAARWLYQKHSILFTSAAISFVAAIVYLYPASFQLPQINGNPSKPNIFLIGMDSVRPDMLGFFSGPVQTPHIDHFLQEATVMPDAITPIARTFPAWVSILMGQYPIKTGVRFNLADTSDVDFNQTLPNSLRKYGYHTIYASDETRFSNITPAFGFDRIISAPIGLNDFILGTLNDLPLSNLMINTRLGAWLFPYSYANRPAWVTYKPDTFINQLSQKLSHVPNKPLFMAVHFCLPHYPYLWAGLSADNISIRERYLASVGRVDQQVGDFLAMLEHAGWLKNSIVIVFSDHGEALELPGDRATDKAFYQGIAKAPTRFFPASLVDESFNQSAGHGTDVLGLTQYHSVLGIQLNGQAQQIGSIPGTVSLIEIKPAVLTLLGLSLKPSHLADAVKGRVNKIPQHDVFIESDYSPAAIRTIYPDIHQVLLEGLNLFSINPRTLHLSVKPEMANIFIKSRQYAVIHYPWMLAVYPQSGSRYIPILLNLDTGSWTDEITNAQGPDLAAQKLLLVLRNHYPQHINLVPNSASN